MITWPKLSSALRQLCFAMFHGMLYPLSRLWELVYQVRRFSYQYGLLSRSHFQVPVISVGNLTFGGTGKTPMTMWVAKHFLERNQETLILTRGYKGKLENQSGILKGGARLGFDPVEYGDEALILARHLPGAYIAVGKKRSKNLSFYFQKISPDVVILDDGHQHLELVRDKNIVLFDALLPLEQYRTAPLGYLREGMTALSDADAIVIGRADMVSRDHLSDLEDFIREYSSADVPVCEIRYSPRAFFDLNFQERFDIQELKGKRAICLAGIASPQSFFKMIDQLGIDVIKSITFPDHHRYNADEISRIIAEAKELDAFILTTEKDIVKLRRVVDEPRLLFLSIEIEFLRGEKEMRELLSSCSLSQRGVE